MTEFVDQLIATINSLPTYITKGLMNLLTATIGGLFVGWIGSTLFARKSQIAEAEGELLKSKVKVYDDLSAKLEGLRTAQTINLKKAQGMEEILRELGINEADFSKRYVWSVFADPETFKDTFLSLDSYIISHRMYFDDDVLMASLVFQNYMGALRRIQTLYEEQIIDKGIDLKVKESFAAESTLMIILGVLFEDEFSQIIDEVLEAMRQSIANLKLSRHKSIPHTAKFFADNGPIMERLKDYRILQEREQIKMLVAVSYGLALKAMHKL